MVLNKLKPYALAAGIGLAGILGSAQTVKAEEPVKQEQVQEKQDMLWGRPITENQKKGLRMLPALPEVVLSYIFIGPFIHESGHALTMLALGHPLKDFQPYPVNGLGGRVTYDIEIDRTKSLEEQRKQALKEYYKFPAHERAAVNMAGLVFSRSYAEGIDALMNKADMNPYVEQALAATYLMTRFEMARYALLSMAQNWGETDPLSGDDVHNFVRLISKDTDAQKGVYVGLAALVALDLALDWDEIADNWDRLWMNNYGKEKEKKGYDIGLAPTNGGMQATFNCKF